ncbi:MAG: HTH domain-containing protein [Parabacteroides sp.]|nr:HTH domain-containing protein [Parabacteroides sp.]
MRFVIFVENINIQLFNYSVYFLLLEMNGYIEKVIQSDPEVIQSDPEQLIELIRMRPTISRTELSKQLGISERQVRKIIDQLRKDGKLTREGGDYKGKWIINKI